MREPNQQMMLPLPLQTASLVLLLAAVMHCCYAWRLYKLYKCCRCLPRTCA